MKRDYVPVYDFNDPNHALPKDSCAAATVANALLRLARVAPDRAPQYRRVARATISELAENYLCDGGILLHGSFGNVAAGGAIPVRFPQEDIIPFGNYYFVEALYHELRPDDWSLFNLRDPKFSRPSLAGVRGRVR
ncbi:MAG: hypothetical protein HY261_01645 [Chloroflexi bacterium]|nr:hypothetical protein [Chloroflexota bacterium]